MFDKKDQPKDFASSVNPLVRVGASFDWFTPAYGMIRSAINGDTKFVVDMNTWWASAWQLTHMMKKATGAKAYGSLIVGNSYVFYVKREHADIAEQYLKNLGVAAYRRG